MRSWGWRSVGARKRLREGLRLSPNEERYILAEALTGQVYAAPSATRIRGRTIDAKAALAALQATCDNHEARRTGFEGSLDGGFTKYVDARATVRLKQTSMPGATDEALIAAVNSHCLKKGDLSPGELHRFILIEVGHEEYVFGMALHHATSDAMTVRAFGLEVLARLVDLPMPAAAAQYSDFWDFDWAASDAYRAAEAFWRGKAGEVGELAAWPADRTGPSAAVRPGEGVVLSDETLARTRQAATDIGVTHFSFFYAAYLVLLSRLTGSARVCTTFQSAGRRAFQGSDGAHGVFSNALMLAMEVDEDESIAELATRIRAEVKLAISHEIYPLHHLIRATGLHPRYAINWMPESQPVTLEGVQFIPLPFEQNQDDDDLNLRFITRGAEVKVVIYYNPAAFSAERVSAATRSLVALADALSHDIRRPIREVRDREPSGVAVLPDMATPLPAGDDRRIFDAFLERARKSPDAVAVAAPDGTLTYSELEARSRDMAAALRAAGVETGDTVAILAERGAAVVAAMLGAARIGAPFMVLDAAYPEPRLADFVEIGGPRAILPAGGSSLHGLAERLAAPASRIVLAEGPVVGAAPVLDQAGAADSAYLLFTSGSTGRPRCVACSHQPLVHFVDWQARMFGLGVDDRVTLLSGLAHDPMLRDVFTALSVGGAIVVPPADVTGDPAALAAWLARSEATVAHLTPQVGRLIAAGAAHHRRFPALRHVFWGGDILPSDLVAAFRGLAAGASQTNFYGATETPQAAAFHRIEADVQDAVVPIGRGVDGVQLLVLGGDGEQLGIGELGEIAVRSNFLPLGYVDAGLVGPASDRREDASGQATIHPTGDRGLYLPDGSVLLVGRTDDQIKVRGHRVHLAEVAAMLRSRPGVRDAAAVAVGEGDERAIVGFVVGRRAAARETDIRDALVDRLPAHMAPRRVIWLEDLPQTPNGKLDRDALQALARPPARPAVGDGSPIERELMERWSRILGAAEVTRESTFASLGGDSLSYVQGYMATEEVVGEAPTGWHLMSVAQLAAARKRRPSGWSTVDTPLVMRAVAICMIVFGHFRMGDHYGGATSALMVVSGFMLGGLAMTEVFSTRSVRPILRVIRNILIPTAIISAMIWLARTPGESPPLHILLFTADFADPAAGRHQETYLWFVHCLLHIMIAIYVAVLGLKAAERFDIGPRRFLYGLFAAACLLRFGLPVLLDPAFYSPGHVHSRIIDFLPTSNMATLLLGGLVATAGAGAERVRLTAVIAGFALLTAFGFGVDHALIVLAVSLLLLVAPRTPLPRLATPIVLPLAGASLWIYLSHMLLHDAGMRLGVPKPLGMVVSLIGGVLFWLVWTRTADFLRRRLRRPPRTVDATV